MNLLPENKRNSIVNNIVMACKNINKLSLVGYHWVNLCPNFIAHYDRRGFICVYSEERSLKNDLLEWQSSAQYKNFKPGNRDYDYMMQKRDMYNEICRRIL